MASISRRWSGASTSSASCSSAGPGPRTATARWCCSSGEPGIGKSRLIRALRERLGDEPYTPLSHYCSPYHTNSALYPVIGLLERAARLDRDEPPEAQLAKLEAVLGRSSDRLDEVVPLLAALLGVPTGERYPALTLTPGGAEAADVAGAGRPARGPGGAAAGAGAVRGRALDRPVDARAPGPRDRAHPAAAGPGADHLPAGVPAALDRPGARHHADHEPSGPAPGGRSGRAGHGRQAAAGGDRRADRGAHRRRAAVRRGADQDGAGIGPARGRRRSLRAVRPAAAARDPDDAARLADGPPRPPRAGQGGRADRRRDRPRVLPRAARRGRRRCPRAELGDALDQLVASELVFRRGAPPDATYSFKHALVQDAAYQSLLKSKRQQLHARIAEALEAASSRMSARPSRKCWPGI